MWLLELCRQRQVLVSFHATVSDISHQDANNINTSCFYLFAKVIIEINKNRSIALKLRNECGGETGLLSMTERERESLAATCINPFPEFCHEMRHIIGIMLQNDS